MVKGVCSDTLFHDIGDSSGFPISQKALRAGSHCGGEEIYRESDPPQAENPAKQDSFSSYRKFLRIS